AIASAVDRLANELETLSHRIHAHPELAYQEVQACRWLTEYLAAHGFKVEKGVAGVDTAFRATLETGAGPTIAILCEYDPLLGIVRVTFEYAGKASHASADPWAGVNALDACVGTYNAVSMLRQQVRPDCRIHGIITNGGQAANIIPEQAAATFYVRAPRIDT